jgi:nucleotide-binding universal stress UspA family protein
MSSTTTPLGIVVAVDGSPASKVAVCWAARDAAMRNVRLTMVHVVNTAIATWPPVPCPETLRVWLEAEGRKVIADAVKVAEDAVHANRKVTIKSDVVYSSPVPALVEMSSEAELLVVGCSGRGLLVRGLLGSVSSSLVRHAHCPVAVIRDEDPLMPHPQRAPCYWASTAHRLQNSRRLSHSTKLRAAASI